MRDALSLRPGASRATACIAVALALVAIVLMLIAGSAAARPVPQPRKVCSAYAREHFHDVTARLPDGTKCIGNGEYCSHGRGFARAYREYGFVCASDGRLEEI